MTRLPVAVRPYDPVTDSGFVVRSWVESSYSGPVARLHRKSLWHKRQIDITQRLLQYEQCLVLHNTSDNDLLYGWDCFGISAPREPRLVHYLYVKSKFRKLGFGNMLLDAAGYSPPHGIKASHTSYITNERDLTMRYGVEYDLFAAH